MAIEAVGVPATFELCADLVRPGGHVANIGVHGKSATLHLETLWTRDVTITTGLVDTYSTPMLLRARLAQSTRRGAFVTHHFPLKDIERRTTRSPVPVRRAHSRSCSPVEHTGAIATKEETSKGALKCT